MFELHQVGARNYYINCPAKIGLHQASENEVYLSDSGNDKDAGQIIALFAENMLLWKSALINSNKNLIIFNSRRAIT